MRKQIFRAPKMVTVDVKFQCSKCGHFVVRPMKIGSHVWSLDAELPEGWVVSVGSNYVQAYCPQHAKDAP
jgi:uncharacterized protein YbdZ (MbtH family)